MERCVLALLGEWWSHDDDDNDIDDDDNGDDSDVHDDDDSDNCDNDVEDGVMMINQLILLICDYVLMTSFRINKFSSCGKEE